MAEPSGDMTAEIPYENLNGVLNEWHMVKHRSNVYMRAINQTGPSTETATAVLEKLNELSPAGSAHKLAIIFEYRNHRVLNSVPSDGMAFATRGTEQVGIGICVWEGNSEEDMATGRAKCHALADVVASLQVDVEASKYRSYGNLDSDAPESSDKAAKMFGENYPKLQKLKKRYDPDMIFNKWMPITPA